MPTMTWEFPADYDGPWPCPQGCGGLTKDPYGGPCRSCWDEVDQTRLALQEAVNHRGA